MRVFGPETSQDPALLGEARRALRTIGASTTAVVLMALVQNLVVLRARFQPAFLPIPALVGFVFGALVSAIRAARARERRMARQLAEAQQARFEAMARLAGGVGHDLNNLLTAGMACSGCVREHAATRAEGACRGCVEALGDLDLAMARARDLGRQLVMLARPVDADPGLVDLRDVVRGLAPVLRRLLGEAVRLDVLAPEAAPVRADRVELEQVVLNLVANSRDAMPQGGVVSIAVRRAPAGVSLAVRDTGAGMDDATRACIFEPFFTTKRGGKGTGLGLMVVERVVQRSRGRIEVRSAPREGTEVTVAFPLAEGGGPVPKTAAA